jgi:hypothetical protein
VTETHATAPVFPAGRYGRRRQSRRTPRWVPAVLAVAVVAVGVLLAVRLYGQYGDPNYRVSTTRSSQITDTGVTVDFTVVVPTGGSAVCLVRARAYSGAVVGTAEVTVAASPGTREIAASHRLTTSERPYLGEAVRCWRASQDR